MKKIIVILVLLVISNSCVAQNTIGLKDATISSTKSIGEVSPNIDYIKDIDNSLDKFIGSWTGEYNNKKYELQFIKKTKYGEKPMKDILLGRMLIKDNSGNILYDTFQKPDDQSGLIGLNFQKDLKIYQLSFSGKNPSCGDSGIIYIYFKDTNNLSLLSVGFLGDGEIVVEEKCQGNKPLFPHNNVAILRLNKK